MNKEYLDIALDKIIETIKNLPIPVMDKIELMINLKSFLSSSYQDNIKTLQKRKEEEKWK